MAATAPDIEKRSEEPVTVRKIVQGVIRTNEFALFMVLIVGCVIVTILNPHFMALSNIGTLGRDIAMIGILAVGEAFVILLGGIDLSVGSVYGLAGVIVALLCVTPDPTQQIPTLGWPIPLAVAATLGICIGIGVIHGLFVSKFHMHGFLITLVTLGLARGIAIAITTGYPITGIPDELQPLAQGSFLNLPIPFILLMVIALIGILFSRLTYIGRHIYAVGGNPEAARLSGIPIDRRIILCYCISSFCAGIVGIISAARLTSGHPSAGTGAELTAIAACVLGGISLFGGQGSILGAFIGAMIMGALANAMIILQVSPYWQQVVLGIVLLIAITFDVWRRRRREAKA
ncbi:MAG: ribose ABC transporter permease [Chloroflexi bacterium]|nr:ribose ABC transporter permease [Chloroflexota bacterium]